MSLYSDLNEVLTPYAEKINGIRTDLNDLQEGGYIADQQKIQEKIDNWLEEHPDVTTSVEDGAITESKLADALKLKIANRYVTPQMYGAKADGTTDDFTAFQNAFASEKKVLILNGSYYLSDYIFVDESQVIDNKGTYVNKKLMISKSVTSAPMSIADRKSIKLAQLGTKWGSGVTYNSDTGKLICCGWEDDKIAQVDFETLTVDTTATISGLAHGNDATYNPNTQKYYCAPMVNNGEIMSINTDLTLDTIITISGIDFAPSQISYDPENDIYYIGNSQYTYAVDANFNVIKLLSTHTGNEIFNNCYENINVPVSQGSAVYKGQFLGGAWLGASGLGLLRGRSYARLVSYNYKTGAIKDFYDFPLRINTEEFEGVEVINGILCLFSCRFGTLFITKVYPEKVYLAHDTANFPYYIDPTYTENSYCTETDVKRIRTFIHGNIGYIRCNLLLSTTMPANTRDVLIGDLGVHIYDETSVILASQSNLGNLLLNIKTDGKMRITNVSTTATCQGFYRANIPVIFT